MDLYEEMGYGKKKDSAIPAVVSTPAPNSQVPEFEVSIKPGDPDYELAKTDPVGYSKKLLAEQKAAIPVAQAEPTVKPTPVKKTGGVDLFNEMYGAEAKKPLRVKQIAPVKKEGVMEGLVIPTGEAALRVGGALAGSLATGTGAIATHVPYMVHDIYKEIKKGKSFKEAFTEGMTKASNRSIETMEFPAKELLKTPEQQESFEKIMTPLGLAGAGWRGMAEYAATGDLQKAADVAEGKSMGSSVLVPWAGAFGDTAFMYALMGKNAVKARWYQMTVKERALVREAAKEVKANIKDSNLTNEQVKELWRDPANREGLRRRFVFGETEEVAAKPPTEPPAKASGVTEQPVVGYEKGKVHPLADMMNVLPEAEMLDLAGAKGEGFTVKPVVEGVVKRGAYGVGEVPRVLPVEYKPYISRNGRPFATEEKAEAVALERGFNPKEFEVVPVEVGQYKGFGYVRTTPVKQKLPIPGQESLAKRMVREVVEERKSEIPEGKLEVPVEVELPKPVELSKFDQMKLETLQKTDPALWNASDKVFMQKLGQPMPMGTPVEKPLTAPAESYAGQRAPEAVERMSEAYSEKQETKTKPEPTAEPVEEPAFKVTDKRSFKDILNDINTALGKKGEVGKDIEVAPESAAARARLREDLARFSEAAKREGKDVEQYMKESGMSAEMLAALTKLNREVGDVSKVDTARKVKTLKEDIRSYAPVIEKEGIAAGADLTTIKARLLKDMLGYSPIRTVVGELLQNSLDATRDNGGKIIIDVADGKLTVTDSGTGMTPETMRDDFITLGRQGTKGSEDMGGFGLAKLPIMGWPDSIDVVSVASTPSEKVISHIWTTREEYMKQHKVNFEERKTSNDAQTGTTITINKEDIRPYEIGSSVRNLIESIRTPQEIVVRRSGYDPETYKGTPLSEAKTRYDVEKFTLPGGTEATVKFTTTEPYGWQEPYKIEVLVYNKGLLLPDIPKYSNFNFTLSKKPDFKVEVDFTKTPSASDIDNYPFLVNRTRLSEGALSKISEIVSRRILDVESNIMKTNVASLKELFEKAPEFSGTKLIIPLKEENLRSDVANIIYDNAEPFIKLGHLYSNFTKLLYTVPDMKVHELAITTEQSVHGFRPKSGLLPKDYIVLNPFSYLKEIDKLYDGPSKTALREAATALTDTMIHEAVHNNVPGHYGDFVKEFHRITKKIGYYRLIKIEKEAYEIFKLHGTDIARITRDIKNVQENGTIADLFSDYSPETQRVNETRGRSGYPVYAQRTESTKTAKGEVVNLITKDVRDFHAKLREEISTGVKEILDKVEAYKDWKFIEGDRVQSKKTGHIWKITARSWNKKENKPTYYAEDLTEPGSKSLFNKGIEETFIKLDGPRSTTLYEGIDPTQTIAVLKGLAKNTREAYNYLSEVGQRIYSSGKTDFVSWRNEFKTALGELWEQYKSQVVTIWNKLKTGVLKPLMNERGSVGYDIGGERIAKQRDLGTLEDGTKLKAPAITEKEFKLLRSLPDMKKKPIGGFTQNPIYAFEDWAASVGPKAQTWVKEKFYYPIREATHRADLHFKNIFDQVEARRKNLPHSSSRRIYYYAISKEAGGAEILKNMRVKEVPKLTEGELEAYNWMRKGYESMYNQINAARIASGIEPIAKVKDYFTFAADMTLAEELGFGFNDAMLGKFVHPKATRFRYAIERIGGIQKVHTDGFGIFERYMKAATKHIYLSPEIAKMREFTGKFDLGKGKTWSMQRSQPRAYANITKYLDFLTGERRTILPDAIERVMVMLNKNITTATLSTNLRSALIQPTALHNTYIEIGPKYTMKGAVDLMRGKGAEAIQKSKVLFNREFDIDIKQTYEGVFGRIGSIKKAINDSWLGMKPLKYLDMQTATTTWLGAFEKAKEVYKMPEEKAIRYADDTVIRTQGSAAAHDLAPLQRIALGRFFSTFQSFVINNFNFLAKDVVGIKNPMMKPAESLHKVGRYVLGATIINTIFEEVLGINSPLPAPVRAAKKTYDKNGSEKEAAVSAMLELLQVVPGFGGLRYGSGVTGAGVDYLKDVTNKLAEEAGEYRGKTKSWGELAGKALGIPGTGQVTKTTKILEKGGTLPEAILGRYPDTSKNELLNLKKETSFDFDKE